MWVKGLSVKVVQMLNTREVFFVFLELFHYQN